VVDAPDRVEALLAELGPMVGEGLATLTPVRVVDDAQSTAQGLREASGTSTSVPGEPGHSQDPTVHVPTSKESSIPMKIEGRAQRVTIYIGSSDTWRGRNLALAIVERCRELGLAGATAMRGVMGFGKNSRIHRAHLLG